jgi:hypothetical protein
MNTLSKPLILPVPFAALALLLAAASGCVSTSEIVPAGKEGYMISGAANGGAVSGQSIIAATMQANEYCAKQGKVMQIRNTNNGGSAGWGGEHSNLIFSCLAVDDPEYARPNLRKDNGVSTVESR